MSETKFYPGPCLDQTEAITKQVVGQFKAVEEVIDTTFGGDNDAKGRAIDAIKEAQKAAIEFLETLKPVKNVNREKDESRQ